MEEQLRDAVFAGNLPTVRRILQQPPGGGFNVNAGDEDRFTVLHLAAIYSAYPASFGDRLPILQALLGAGADPNAADFDGYTPLFYYIIHPCPISTVEALLDAGADPAVRNRVLDTPIHHACMRGRLDVVELLIQRQGSECLTLKNNRDKTPLDRLLLAQNHYNTPVGVTNSIRQHILQTYAGMIAQRDGLLCLHSVLQDAAFTDAADDDEADEEFELPVGTLNTEHLQKLLEYIIAMEPGSVRALNSDGLLPLQVASQLNYPDLVLNALLRPYPDALLLL